MRSTISTSTPKKFDPVLSAEQMRSYVDVTLNTREVEAYVERLRAADALALVFPVWFDGLPAIMQGYFQRVFLPGVATVIDAHGLFHPNLRNLKRMAAVCAYGETRPTWPRNTTLRAASCGTISAF